MREAAFIKANKEKWDRINEETQDNDIKAEVLAENFIELTDDLSYACTFYPKSRTQKYLNQLAARYFVDIYKYRPRNKGRFIKFWIYELPLIMNKYRRQMLYSFLFMLVGALVGAFSLSQNPDFAYFILGEDYVNMTLNNIAKGDPMAVYKDENKELMYYIISTNNIKVAFNAFIWGIFGSVITVWLLWKNGVMLGVFQFFFYKHGLLGTSAITIWMHGTLEISAIIIAGGAGLILGNSLLFPGSYRRIDSLLRAAKDAMKIAVGLIPVFLVAGFIESYMTRLTEMDTALKLSVIVLSAAFILWYFFIYPWRLNGRIQREHLEMKADEIGTEIESDKL